MAVRSLIQLLPEIDVVKGDVFNSSPTYPQLMGPDAGETFQKGEPPKDGQDAPRADGRSAVRDDGRQNLRDHRYRKSVE